ncbi:MAG TPA: outer membrane protein assembly factor BamD, partial [Chthoniobacterales bacterium]|nr:outer membrane protein assembly factor BamD [Chthoniobacterales bacterium]
LFATAQAAERDGNRARAIKAYSRLIKKYPDSTLAAGSLFSLAGLVEAGGDALKAARYYRALMEYYPKTEHFQEAIEAQFRIGEEYLKGKKLKLLGIPIASSKDTAVEIFAAIVRSAPYGRYTARAQFDIGRAREQEGGAADLAIEAYQSVVDKFPNDPLAVDAQYQIGYMWMQEARRGSYDPKAAERARTAFEDFLFRFPNSEKVPQAKENLRLLERRQTDSSLAVAQYYDHHKYYRAAVIYYNEVIRQHPGTPESTVAKNRIDQLRKKIGDRALESAATLVEEEAKKHPKKPVAQASPAASRPPTEERAPVPPQMRGNANDIAPLPPSSDSLPPPASDASESPAASATPTPSPTPEASATP